MDINPKSHHFTAFELINLQLYINFSSFKCKIYLKYLKSTLHRLFCCDFVTSLVSECKERTQHLSPDFHLKHCMNHYGWSKQREPTSK